MRYPLMMMFNFAVAFLLVGIMTSLYATEPMCDGTVPDASTYGPCIDGDNVSHCMEYTSEAECETGAGDKTFANLPTSVKKAINYQTNALFN